MRFQAFLFLAALRCAVPFQDGDENAPVFLRKLEETGNEEEIFAAEDSPGIEDKEAKDEGELEDTSVFLETFKDTGSDDEIFNAEVEETVKDLPAIEDKEPKEKNLEAGFLNDAGAQTLSLEISASVPTLTSVITTTPRPTPTIIPGYGLRLAGGRWRGEGRVEIFYNGAWGTVCDDSWDLRDARVVCRELGYPSASGAPQAAHFGAGRGQILLDDVHCLGNESSIRNCRHRGWTSHNCNHREDASVICSTAQTTPRPTSTNQPSPPKPNFAFVIVCKPASMEVNISRDSLPSDVEPSLLHLADPACGVHHVSKKNIFIKAPLEGCGTVRRSDGERVSYHNKVMATSSVRSKRSLGQYPFSCAYHHVQFP